MPDSFSFLYSFPISCSVSALAKIRFVLCFLSSVSVYKGYPDDSPQYLVQETGLLFLLQNGASCKIQIT